MNILVLYADNDSFVIGRSRYKIRNKAGEDNWWFTTPDRIKKAPPYCGHTIDKIMVMCDIEIYHSIVGYLYPNYSPEVDIQEIK